MYYRNLAVAAVLGISGAMVSSTAIAQSMADRGWYVGGSIGEMEADGSCPPGFSCDFKDTAFKVFGGYRINRNFAAEGFWGEWGDITIGVPGASAKVEARTFGVAALGILPVGRLDLFAKLGIGHTKLKASGGGLLAGATDSDSGRDLLFGFGAAYNFTEGFGVRAEWERLDDSELDVISVGLQYRF